MSKITQLCSVAKTIHIEVFEQHRYSDVLLGLCPCAMSLILRCWYANQSQLHSYLGRHFRRSTDRRGKASVSVLVMCPALPEEKEGFHHFKQEKGVEKAIFCVQDAVLRGVFRTNRSPTSGQADLRTVAMTALEIASAMVFLHSNNVVHGVCGHPHCLLCVLQNG